MEYPLDHIGIAVKDIDTQVNMYSRMFGFEFLVREEVPSMNTEVCFIKVPNTKIELLTPMNEDSPIAGFLKKRGEGMHHMCYEVQDLREELKRLEELNFRLIDKEPRAGACNKEIAFLHPKTSGGCLIELAQIIR